MEGVGLGVEGRGMGGKVSLVLREREGGREEGRGRQERRRWERTKWDSERALVRRDLEEE